MNESEVRMLFFIIQNSYPFFDDNDDKVTLWVDLLKNTPFDLAHKNTVNHIMNHENDKPPHPGILARRPEQEAQGPYVPGVQETRLMLAEMDRQAARALASPVPEHLRGRFKIEPPREHTAT